MRKAPRCEGAQVSVLRSYLKNAATPGSPVRRTDLNTCKVHLSKNLAVINRTFPTRGSGGTIGHLVHFEVVRTRNGMDEGIAIVDSVPRGGRRRRAERFAMRWADAGTLAEWICKRVGVTHRQLNRLKPHLKHMGVDPAKCYDWEKGMRHFASPAFKKYIRAQSALISNMYPSR